jgi:hypothetical protein|tara:strand:+ start:556 stop:708 length:153 start_codon:yes stop_codon:yes gene_type:complete
MERKRALEIVLALAKEDEPYINWVKDDPVVKKEIEKALKMVEEMIRFIKN